MASPTEVFFEELSRRGHEPMLGKAIGTIRLDLAVADGGSERWFVSIDRGDVRVSRDGATAGCIVRADRSLFDAIASGRANPMAAMLRGALIVEGDPDLLVLFQRLLPGPPDARVPRPVAVAGRQS